MQTPFQGNAKFQGAFLRCLAQFRVKNPCSCPGIFSPQAALFLPWQGRDAGIVDIIGHAHERAGLKRGLSAPAALVMTSVLAPSSAITLTPMQTSSGVLPS